MKLRDEQSIQQRVAVLTEALETALRETPLEVYSEEAEPYIYAEYYDANCEIGIRRIAERLEVLLS